MDATILNTIQNIKNEARRIKDADGFDVSRVYFDDFDLSAIPYELEERAISALVERDIKTLLEYIDSTELMAFVFDNHLPLLVHDMYEEALISAYVRTKVNLHSWEMEALRFVFKLADRTMLLKYGEKIPTDLPMVAYRGVSGEGDAYRPRGLSWTSSFEIAKRFALFPEQRYGKVFPNCSVFRTTVYTDNLYFYSNGRTEEEYVCDIQEEHAIEICWQKP